MQTSFLEKIRLPLEISDYRLAALSDQARQLLSSSRFDDLSQMVRKHCLTRSEIAILLSVLSEEGDREERHEETR